MFYFAILKNLFFIRGLVGGPGRNSSFIIIKIRYILKSSYMVLAVCL